MTTKSLYVSGAGNDVELAGILAYVAESSGWGSSDPRPRRECRELEQGKGMQMAVQDAVTQSAPT